jgi:hypothetical protein
MEIDTINVIRYLITQIPQRFYGNRYHFKIKVEIFFAVCYPLKPGLWHGICFKKALWKPGNWHESCLFKNHATLFVSY